MSTSKLTLTGDWTFGNGRNNYIIKSDEVKQNVVTNIQCFFNDWFLDIDYGIDWYSLLGNKNTEDKIVSEIERVTLSTPGMASIDTGPIVSINTKRKADIFMIVTDIFSRKFAVRLENGV